MKFIYPLLSLLLLGISGVQAQQFTWAEMGGNTLTSYGSVAYDIKTDNSGNVYTSGFFAGDLILGNDTLTSVGMYDIFICKHSAAGVLLWAWSGGGEERDYGFTLKLSPAGEVYFTGKLQAETTGIVRIGTVQQAAKPLNNYPFIGKLDQNGNFLWASIGGNAQGPSAIYVPEYGFEVALDGNLDPYLIGNYTDTLRFGTLSTPGRANGVFIAKFTSFGTPLWIKLTSGNWHIDKAAGIKIGQNGNIYLSGTEYTTGGPSDPTLARLVCLDLQGNHVWSRDLGSGANFQKAGIAALIQDAQGNLICNGSFRGTISNGGTTLTSATGIEDGFIASFSSSGNPLWLIKSTSGSNGDYSYDLEALPGGGFVESGVFYQQATIGNTAFISNGGYDAYFCERDANGSVQWVVRFGGGHDDSGDAISKGPNGEIYIGGSSSGNVNFGGQTYSFIGASNSSLYFGRIGNLLERPQECRDELLISTHPNPTNSFLTFTYPTLQSSARLTLTDALGRTVFQQTLSQGSTQHTADLSQLPEAVYFYHIATESGSIGSGKVAIVR